MVLFQIMILALWFKESYKENQTVQNNFFDCSTVKKIQSKSILKPK